MKILVTGDLQLAPGDRDKYRLDFLSNTLPGLIRKHKPDQLIIAGDLTEPKDNHPADLVNKIVTEMSSLAKLCKIIILQGNHDFLHKSYPFFQFLEHIPNIQWIGVPTEQDGCLFLPHTRDYKKDWKDMNMEGYNYIFAHNIFSGVTANGLKMSGVPSTIFPDDAVVISGDVHEPQSFDVITYVGSPYLCDHGDSYNPRVLLLDALSIKSIKVSGPQKRLVTVDWKTNYEQADFHGEVREGDIVKFKVNIGMDHVADWVNIRELVSSWGISRGLVMNTIQPVVEVIQGERQKLVKGKHKSDNQFFEAYVARAGIDAKSAEVGKELMED